MSEFQNHYWQIGRLRLNLLQHAGKRQNYEDTPPLPSPLPPKSVLSYSYFKIYGGVWVEH